MGTSWWDVRVEHARGDGGNDGNLWDYLQYHGGETICEEPVLWRTWPVAECTNAHNNNNNNRNSCVPAYDIYTSRKLVVGLLDLVLDPQQEGCLPLV